ncbi:DUF6470 family protein [Peribacillus sp. Hz7]|uniref:DUF6470 family protein n=1 Tax=Peribacillus sp. Hz7 TaxID=3344873 RepID=UPI0035C9BDC0
MLQIRMQSTFIQTGLQIEDPVQRIEQPKAIQSIEQPKAIVNMETTPGKLTIDQTEAWEQMDIKHISKRTAEYAQEGKQKLLEGIARRSRQGDEMMHIERGGNVIKAHAKENSERPPKQFNIGWIPSPFSVKMHYQQAKLNIEAQAQKPIIDVQVQKPIHDYTPGDVKVNVIRENSLDIDFVNV